MRLDLPVLTMEEALPLNFLYLLQCLMLLELNVKLVIELFKGHVLVSTV